MAVTAKDKVRQVEPGIWKLTDDRFYVEIRPGGRDGKKVKKTLDKLDDARKFKTNEFAKAHAGDSPLTPSANTLRMSDLVEEWYKLHGYSLKDGLGRKGVLLFDCELMGNPIASKFTAEDFVIFRKSRLETPTGQNTGKMITANTVNHSQAYFCAVFNTLIKLGKWNLPNPLHKLQKLKIDEPDLCFLDKAQIKSLLSELKLSNTPDMYIIAKICLSTGARWGEAASLKATHVKGNKIHYSKTKSGKARSIPITTELQEEILTGRPKSGLLFNQKNHRHGFEDAVARAGIKLPDGQMTHVLRHTFASHFMINDGNILKLKEILGHSTLDMTIRYAKLAPSHLSQAVTHNPIATLLTS
ncbi:phage integrase [Cellvibrio sp. UBA7671]|uniref:phage integrase n=1 Tax=Cellvibrio sp. UBA7671 TaxID=1946312 RepID=UPI002F353DA9